MTQKEIYQDRGDLAEEPMVIDRQVNGLRMIAAENCSEYEVSLKTEVYALVVNLADQVTIHYNGLKGTLRRNKKVFIKLNDATLAIAGNEKSTYFILAFDHAYIREVGLEDSFSHELLFRDEQNCCLIDHIPAIVGKLMDLKQTSLKNVLMRVYLRAKVSMILCLLLDSLQNNIKSARSNVPADQQEKVLLVKEMIENNLDQNYTISALSKQVGTNEQYLKLNFKKYVGQTIFGYMTACKMNRAKILLKTTDLKISQISQQVGYKHPTHFAGAFKRFFGYIPNMIRCMGFYLADSLELFILGEELLLPF